MTLLSMRKNSAGYVGLALVWLLIAFSVVMTARWRVNGQGGSAVTIVNAASFDTVVAPDSIAAAFGSKLAITTAKAEGDADPNTPGIQLPTTLGGTTVEVNGRLAGLFFVSRGQINFAVPAATALGDAAVTVRAGDGTVTMGTARVEAVAPGIFTADSTGQGVPAALILRVRANGEQQFEPAARFDPATNKFATIPIDLGPPGERVFLILYLTGARGAVDADGDNNLNDAIHLLLGGGEIVPAYAGKAGAFVGLDQVNVEIPRGSIGRGAVELRVNYSTLTQSNAVKTEIAGPPQPPRVASFDPATALVGAEVTINGTNFAASANENQVYFVDEDGKNFPARVTAAGPAQIKTIVPFGAGSGPALVRTTQGEVLSAARLALRTSISGFVETTEKLPLPGVAVRVREQNIRAVTDVEGKYILPDVPPGSAREVEFDPSSLPLPFPKYATKLRVRGERDHHLERVTLRQITGPSLAFTTPGSLAAVAPDLDPTSFVFAPMARSIQSGGVVFEVADNTTAIFPGGATSGSVFLNLIENGRTPGKLPPGVFSSTIAQLAPFGVLLAPGGKLTFPNADNLPVNSQPKLYKLNQTSGSPTLGEFIEAGAAVVSADGQRVETATNAIAETSIYFVAIRRPVTNLIGRVVDSDGATPVRGARVSARGQEATTDGTGLFVLLNVPFSGVNDRLTIEASFHRPGGRVDRADRSSITPVPNGTTRAPDLVLTSPATIPNRPPTVIAPPSLSVTEGASLDYGFLASDPDSGQTIQVTVSGVPFASVGPSGVGSYNLRLAPGAGAANDYTLVVRATDSQGASTTRNIMLTVFTNRPPTLIVPPSQATNVGQTLSFVVTATDPDLGQTLNFAAQPLPEGATFTPLNATSARFSWTPSSGQIGRYEVSFKVTDNGLNNLNQTSDVAITVVSQWGQTPGPYGGFVTSFLVSGNKLYAGVRQGGVFVSTNGGQNWSPSNNGLNTKSVEALAEIGSNLYAGTLESGVFVSTNSGQNWSPINNGLSSTRVYALAVIGSNLYAGTRDGGVFVSTNSGQSWSAMNNGLSNMRVFALRVNSGSLYALTDGGGVFVSTNGGQSWNGIKIGSSEKDVYALAVIGGNLYAGTNGDGVFVSTNGGQNWSAVNNGLSDMDIYALAGIGNNLFAATWGGGMCVSTNGGQSWNIINNGMNNRWVYTLTVIGSALYAGADGSAFTSANGGQSWSTINSGLSASVVEDFAMMGSNLYVGTFGSGVFVSTNNGQSWSLTDDDFLNPFFYSLVVSGNSLYAGTGGGGVFLSADNGASWSQINNGLGNKYVRTLLVNGANIYAGTLGGGVFVSTNGGQSWSAMSNGLSNLYVFDLAESGGNLYAATREGFEGSTNGGVYVSTNGGAGWNAINNGLSNRVATTLAISGGNLYAGTIGGGVFVSTNGGASWSAINNGLGNMEVYSVVVSGGNLYAGTWGGVFVSTNGGQSWSAINNGLSNTNVFKLFVRGDNVYAGTFGGGVFAARF